MRWDRRPGNHTFWLLSKHSLIFVQPQVKKILIASPFGELEETNKTPSYYVDEDYPAGPEIQQLSLNEAVDVALNHPLETDVYIWR